jgi:hypothetical protein
MEERKHRGHVGDWMSLSDRLSVVGDEQLFSTEAIGELEITEE